MPIIRKFAIQGHDIPKHAYAPRGLEGALDPAVMRQSPINYEGEKGDSLHAALDDIRLFRCKDCGTILYEAELSDHDCDEEDEPLPDA